MAKKSVATLQTGSKRLTKVIKMVKKGILNRILLSKPLRLQTKRMNG